MNTIGQRIKALRKKRGITRKDLASATGISYSALSDLESNRSKNSVYLYKIANELKATIDWLETGNGPIDAPGVSQYGLPDPEILRDALRVMLRSIEKNDRTIETLADAELICFTYGLISRERLLGTGTSQTYSMDNVTIFRRILAKKTKT